MAVSIVDSVIAGNTVSGSNLTSGNITVSGTDKVLWVWLYNSDGSRAAPTSVKWQGSGGTSLTQVGTNLAIGPYAYLSLWELVNPTAATDTIYATWGSAQSGKVIYGVSMDGVDQSTPKGTVATAAGTSLAPSVAVTSTSGETVLDFVGDIDLSASTPGASVGAGQTQLETLSLPIYERAAGSYETASGSSTTMSWTLTGGFSSDWGIIGFSVVDATGGGGGGGLLLPQMHQRTNTLLRM